MLKSQYNVRLDKYSDEDVKGSFSLHSEFEETDDWCGEESFEVHKCKEKAVLPVSQIPVFSLNREGHSYEMWNYRGQKRGQRIINEQMPTF